MYNLVTKPEMRYKKGMIEPISDALWAKIKPLLPPEPSYPQGGRPRVTNRAALNGIRYILKTGTAWNLLPQELEYGSGLSCWRRLNEWQQAGVWAPIQQILKEELPETARSDWSRTHLKADENSGVGAGNDRIPDVPEGSNRLLFGTWLKECRKALDITQEELARRVGCAPVSIRKFEAGTLRPSRQMAETLAARLTDDAEKQAAIVRMARTVASGEEASTQHVQPRKAGNADVAPAADSLPIPATSFIGRADEVATVQTLLRRQDVRLLTLTGPPGIGKTRLALQVAANNAASFEQGVAFVSLGLIRDPAEVAAAVAEALKLRPVTSQWSAEHIGAQLQNKNVLLVLDSFEHLISAAEVVANMVQSALRLKVLVTSREPLRLYGEHEFPVPPLALPDPQVRHSAEGLAQVPAVDLFVQRAQAVTPGFALTGDNANAVVEICRHLDGIPLAIELAAARNKLFPPAVLLERLTATDGAAPSLQILTGGPRDWPRRQQTLRDAITWSHTLLTPEEQTLFRRLAVFVGGCMWEAAAAICEIGGDLELDILEELASLVDKSLLRQTMVPGGGVRFGMLEVIHEYAAERLLESGEADALHRQHADYYLAQLERVAEQIDEPATSRKHVQVNQEHDNLRAVLNWIREQGDRERVLRMLTVLWGAGIGWGIARSASTWKLPAYIPQQDT